MPDYKKTDGRDDSEWYAKQGFTKTEWGYEIKSKCGNYGQGVICNMELYRKQKESEGCKFYDTTLRPTIKELKPGESAIVKI